MFIVEYDDTFVKGQDIEELRLELAIRIDNREYIEDFNELIKSINGVVKVDIHNCSCVDLAEKLNEDFIDEEMVSGFQSVEECGDELIALYCLYSGDDWYTSRDRDNFIIHSAEDYVEYCKERALDCGDIGKGSYLLDYIDWERFAKDCARDHDNFNHRGLNYVVERI
jgi:hypothetical protein